MAQAGKTKCIVPVLVLLFLIGKGSSNCTPSNVQVEQKKIGDIPPGDEEYMVVVTNPTDCVESSVVLSCNDFNSIEAPDISVIDWDGSHIYIKPDISAHSSVSFKYSWPHQQTITPSSSQQCC